MAKITADLCENREIHRKKITACVNSQIMTWYRLSKSPYIVDPWAAEFGRRRRILCVSRKRNSIRPASPTAVRRRRRIQIRPPSSISFFVT